MVAVRLRMVVVVEQVPDSGHLLVAGHRPRRQDGDAADRADQGEQFGPAVAAGSCMMLFTAGLRPVEALRLAFPALESEGSSVSRFPPASGSPKAGSSMHLGSVAMLCALRPAPLPAWSCLRLEDPPSGTTLPCADLLASAKFERSASQHERTSACHGRSDARMQASSSTSGWSQERNSSLMRPHLVVRRERQVVPDAPDSADQGEQLGDAVPRVGWWNGAALLI
jgi:hypothetical protein